MFWARWAAYARPTARKTLMLGGAATLSLLPQAYGAGRTLCSLPAPITESSGIVASSRSDNVFFTHNDSGDSARFFAIDRKCQLLATVNVTGATAIDWEDMARGPGRGGKPALFLGDIGDNTVTRKSVVVYEVPEPDIDESKTGVTVTARAIAHRFTYEDGPHDAETLLVGPAGDIVIVTKSDSGISRVYRAGGTVLKFMTKIDFNPLAEDFGFSLSPIAIVGRARATGGDVTADGTRVIVRTYAGAFEWRGQGSEGDVASA